MKGLDKLKNNINKIYERRQAALYALCLFYSAKALNDFRQEQAQNKYWQNRTFTAYDTVFTNAFSEKNGIGWFIAHAVEYGVYLELANNREHEALRPTIIKFTQSFVDAVKSLYKD